MINQCEKEIWLMGHDESPVWHELIVKGTGDMVTPSDSGNAGGHVMFDSGTAIAIWAEWSVCVTINDVQEGMYMGSSCPKLRNVHLEGTGPGEPVGCLMRGHLEGGQKASRAIKQVGINRERAEPAKSSAKMGETGEP